MCSNESPKQVQTVPRSELVDLVAQANTGDAQALARLKLELEGRNAETLLNIAGDLAYGVEKSTIASILGDAQPGGELVLQEKLNRMRGELGWNTAPKLERILIERVCQTWLFLHLLEMASMQAEATTVGLAEYADRRIERVERRHMQAVKMLATVRKLAMPVRIEVNAELNFEEATPPAIGPRNRFKGVNSYN